MVDLSSTFTFLLKAFFNVYISIYPELQAWAIKKNVDKRLKIHIFVKLPLHISSHLFPKSLPHTSVRWGQGSTSSRSMICDMQQQKTVLFFIFLSFSPLFKNTSAWQATKKPRQASDRVAFWSKRSMWAKSNMWQVHAADDQKVLRYLFYRRTQRSGKVLGLCSQNMNASHLSGVCA